jgi:hypothetical protein
MAGYVVVLMSATEKKEKRKNKRDANVSVLNNNKK